MYKLRILLLALCASVLLLAGASRSLAQGVTWTNAGVGDWNSGSNWSGPFGNNVPEAQFGESALITNGGTAFLEGSAPAVGGIVLGQTAGQAGTLEVRSDGDLSVVAESGTNGGIVVGQGGNGTLIVRSGGNLAAASLTAGGGQGGTIRLVGPDAGLSTTSSASLLANNTLISEITSTAFSPLAVAGSATLGGVYKVEFSGGFTPSVGNSWSIIDAATVTGNFSSVDTSSAPALPLGQQLVVTSRPGGLGTLVELRLEQLLILNINRTTGAMTITNAAGGQPVAFDVYTVASNAGSLNPADWNSLHDQSLAGWIEANPSGGRLSEVKSSDAATLNGGNSLSLGNAYAPGSPGFGVPVEDLTFRYSQPDGSEISGIVNYTGGVQKFNNLVLEINSSGTAQIFNDSLSPVSIDGYTIVSSDGSLLATSGNWNSLDDQNTAGGDWLEANGSANRLSEFKADGTTLFNSSNGVNLGQIFNTDGNQSGVAFEFLIAGQSPTLFEGAVVFRDLSSSTPIGSGGIAGDYNDDRVVDAADYTVWRDNLGSNASLPNDPTSGSVTLEDYTVWKSNFGASATAGSGTLTAAAVPEPTTAYLFVIGVAAIVLVHHHRRQNNLAVARVI